jgi:energy-coupling factor transporter transmembrane protein EcfT
MKMFKINIITQLLIFFVIAISVNFLQLNIIIGLFVFLMLLLVFTKNNGFLQSVKRFKWFFMVMVLIIAFNTPGQHVTAWPFSISSDYISPTYEGIKAGFTQMLRILLMLASLSLIMAINTRQQLISGFYFIFLPLQYFGLKVERFAARLWLTLHYVELQGETRDKQNFISQLKNMTSLMADDVDNNINAETSIIFAVPGFNFADYLTLLLLIVAVLHMLKVF